MFLSPSHIDPSLDSRSVTFENPTGARGAGGQTYDGRKGRPSATIPPGETVVLADLDGPGTLRHLWMTFPPAPPETMRALWMEVFYDGAARAERVGAVPRLLRHAARAPGAVRVGAHVGAGRARVQLVSPDAVRAARARRGHELGAHADVALLPDRLHARARARRHGQLPPRCVPSREPDRVAARLRHRRRPRRSRPVRRLQRRRARARRGHVVRRGRAEGVPRRRRGVPHDLRHRPRGLRRERVGPRDAITSTTRARR